MDGVIRNRNDQWLKESRIKGVLYDIQMLVRLCEALDAPAEKFADIIYFVLDQFPVAEGQNVDGNVSDAWSEFEEGIPNYTIEEFYTRVMHPCDYKEESK